MAVVAIVSWLLVAAFRRDWLPSSRLVPAIAACLAAFAIATVTSRIPRLSAEMLAYAVLLAELYLLLVALMRRTRLRAHFERLALALCLLVCALYLPAGAAGVAALVGGRRAPRRSLRCARATSA